MLSNAVYPSVFHQTVLAQEAPGGLPVALDITVPTVTRPGLPFDVKVAVLDKHGYPSLHCNSAVKLHILEKDAASITFRHGVPAVGSLQGLQLSQAGLFRLDATCDRLQAHSNPTLCTAEGGPEIYWGDPHVHTILSNCHADKCRSLNFCFTAARYLSALDWVAATDHVSNGRCEISKWKEQRTVADLYNDPPDFVTLPAYEASFRSGAGGDNNVYLSRFPGLFVDLYESGNVKSLCRQLPDQLAHDQFFVVPHHTTRANKHGEIPDAIYPGPQAMPVIEIHSKWGTSEYRGNSQALKKIHAGPSYAMDLLNRGMKLGFIAGTDSHATMPAGGGVEPSHLDRLPGLTAVHCPELTRQAVFDAIRRRQCYAASLERILMQGSIAGHTFGEELSFAERPTPLKIDMVVAAKSTITRIELVRNGKTISTVTPGSWQAHFTYQDREDLENLMMDSSHSGHFLYYYLRVTCESGAQAWSSPVWILA